MKKILLFNVFLLFLSLMVGCEKDETTKIKKDDGVNFKDCKDYSEKEKKKEYVWYAGYGDEEGAWLIQQAKHFKFSDFIESGVYKYQPDDRYLGIDSVLISTNTGSDGTSLGVITNYKIKFYITKCGMVTKKEIIK